MDVRVHDDLWSTRTAFLTGLAHTVTWAGSIYVLGPGLVLLGAVLPRTRVSLRRLLWMAVVLAVAVTSRMLVQPWVDRPRPPTDGILSDGPGASFPSGHAVQVVVAVGVLYLTYPRTRPGRGGGPALVSGLVVVGAVAWSRLYLGVHWLTDVSAGVILGVALLALAAIVEPATDRVRDH